MTAEQKLEQLRAHDPGVAIRRTYYSYDQEQRAYRWKIEATRVLDGRRLSGESISFLDIPGNENMLPSAIDAAVHELGHAMLSYQSKPITLEELG